jgi:hypothetical protein
MEMIHLYIYFKQENAKKNLCFFSVAVFLRYLFKTHKAGKLLLRRNASFKSCILGKKQYPRMFLGTILLKVAIRNKIFVSCIGFQSVDTLE